MNLTFVYVLVGWIFSVCLHEWAHARVAYEGGDLSVKDKGYLNFNPLAYTDPFLSILLPIAFLVMGGIGLPGGAVYIIEQNLKNATWRTMVALAGPASNLVLAVIIALILRFVPPPVDGGRPALAFLCVLQISAVYLNLIPIPPLDGYNAIKGHLDGQTRATMESLGMMGIFLIFILLRIPAVNDSFWNLVWTTSRYMGVDSDIAWAGKEQFMFWTQ